MRTLAGPLADKTLAVSPMCDISGTGRVGPGCGLAGMPGWARPLWMGGFGRSGCRVPPVLGIAPQSVHRAAAREAARAADWARVLAT